MDRGEGVIENREMFLDPRRKHKLVIANTLFQKQEKHKATYREIGVGIDVELERGNFEQMNFM